MSMTGNEYQEMAMITDDGFSTYRLASNVHTAELKDVGGIVNGCLGLAGETGEFNDLIKKWIFHEHDLDEEHAKRELGDVLWYVALICNSFGWKLGDVMQLNIDKLKARYPTGFDVERSEHRKEGDI